MMHQCAIRKGFCRVDKFTYVWDAASIPLCYPAPFYNQTIDLHTDKEGKVMNIRIPSLGLAYSHLTPCPPYVINCQTGKQRDLENLHCSAEGMVFYTAGCEELKEMRENVGGSQRVPGANSKNDVRGHVENIFALDTYNFLEDELEDLQQETNILRYLTACRLHRVMDQVFKRMSRLFPSEIASLALGRKTAAIYEGDVLREILCKPQQLKLNLGMRFNGTIAARPIATSVDPVTNQIRYFQLHTDGNFYPGINYFGQYNPEHNEVFFINNTFHRYVNYTLTQRRANVTMLKITDEYQKVPQRKPVDFELRDEILEKALVNKPKDYIQLERNMEESMRVNRQIQKMFSKELFDRKTGGTSQQTKLDQIAKPGIVASLSTLSPGAQAFVLGMHFISWMTSSGVMLVIIILTVCYCRGRVKKNSRSGGSLIPIRYEKPMKEGKLESVTINVGQHGKDTIPRSVRQDLGAKPLPGDVPKIRHTRNKRRISGQSRSE